MAIARLSPAGRYREVASKPEVETTTGPDQPQGSSQRERGRGQRYPVASAGVWNDSRPNPVSGRSPEPCDTSPRIPRACPTLRPARQPVASDQCAGDCPESDAESVTTHPAASNDPGMKRRPNLATRVAAIEPTGRSRTADRGSGVSPRQNIVWRCVNLADASSIALGRSTGPGKDLARQSTQHAIEGRPPPLVDLNVPSPA